MTTRYVEVPAQAIRDRLAAAGFVEAHAGTTEEVYERRHSKAPGYAVKVYSSITAGNDKARRCGADAIRVVAVFHDVPNGRTTGVYKCKRVFRTAPTVFVGSPLSEAYRINLVLDRMIERCREAYAFINDRIAGDDFIRSRVNQIGGGK